LGIWTPTAITRYPTGVVDSIATSGGWVLLSIDASVFAPSDAAGDDQGLQLISKLADECKQKGLPGVALYPHVGYWIERESDAVRLATKAARPDVGVVFNQYHWMKAEGGQALQATLKAAAPFLKLVTINGSDLEPSILPLGQGAYDVLPILQTLVQLDFHGSVGLQGYSIAGDLGAKLQASHQAWTALIAGLK
jgi:sugar phosphate isomerase/epimerase